MKAFIKAAAGRFRKLLPLAAAAAALLTAGCGGGIIRLTEVDNGKVVSCSPGSVVEIALPGNPTTGYSWQPARMPADSVLVLTENQFRQYDAAGKNLVGVPGTYVFRYEVTGKGSEGIQLQYIRAWENLPPSGIYEVLIRAE